MRTAALVRRGSAGRRLPDHHRDSFDRPIVAQAQIEGLPLGVPAVQNSSLDVLAAGHRADDKERLGARHNRLRQRGVRRLVRQVLLAGEEPHERPALMGR